MVPEHTRGQTAAIVAVSIAMACGSAVSAFAQAPNPARPSNAELSALARARIDSASRLFTAADVRFMTGMISHHAQAITMSRWAPTHGANSSVRTLAERIINAQQDEIVTMRRWLRDRGQPVPDSAAMDMHDMNGMHMAMSGNEHEMLMPGMLTAAQMHELDQARGSDFDRLFLTDMIQHHRGAVSMVKELFSSYGAGQDEAVFKFASDVNVDQSTEIARMERMLLMLTLETTSR